MSVFFSRWGPMLDAPFPHGTAQRCTDGIASPVAVERKCALCTKEQSNTNMDLVTPRQQRPSSFA